MPLVKGGKITDDAFVHVADDARAAGRRRDPDFGRAVSRGCRSAVRAASGKTGVIWPNNRDIDDLVPYLDRLAVVALVFPTFRDGRAYSQARLLRERYGYRGELRATGQVLRDQFVFMLRAGFDAFEVKKQSDAEAFASTVEALFGVLPADRRWPHHRAAPADAAAPFGECQPVNALAPSCGAAAESPRFAVGARSSIARFATPRRRRSSRPRCRPSAASSSLWCRRSAPNRRRCSR